MASWMQCSFIRICVCLSIGISETTKTKRLQISEEITTWNNSKLVCNGNLAGRTVFNDCQPSSCRLDVVRGLEQIARQQTVWVNGYVKRSPQLEYYGCYEMKIEEINSTIDALPAKMESQNNNVLDCSRFCEGKKSAFILLRMNNCYCLSDDTKRQWNRLHHFDDVATRLCNYSCPSRNGLYFCGGNDRNNIFLTVFRYIQSSSAYRLNRIGTICFFHNEVNAKLNHGDCSVEKKFKCQKREVKNGVKDWSTVFDNTTLNWYEARQKCKEGGRFLQTRIQSRGNNAETTRVDTWHNRFIIEKIMWDPDTDQEDQENSCIAIHKTKDGKYEFWTENCKLYHPVLCEQHKTGSVNPELDFETPIVVGSITSVVLLIIIVIIVSVFLVRRRNSREKNGKERSKPVDSHVYYSSVDKSFTQTTERKHTENNPLNQGEDDLYNHLGDEEPTVNMLQHSNIYDHAGITTENDYDLSCSNGKSRNSDDNAYDDTR